MRRVVISRATAVTALGDNLDTLWHRLMSGQTGIAPVTRFDTTHYFSSMGASVEGLTVPVGGSRLDAILERVSDSFGAVPEGCRLLVASTKGEIDRLEISSREARAVPAAALFEPLLAKVARRFNLTDRGSNINAACASSTVAVARGAAMIASGQAESVLVYAADLLSEFVFSGFSALQALSAEPCRPFDRQRSGLNLGEAGVALLLTSEAMAGQGGHQPLAYVAGWGASNDAHHVTAPARDGSGLIRASRQALNRAGISPGQIAAINAHGTGTVYNDAMELTAFAHVFGDELPPLHGVKGSLGHCLGAAGGVEIAVACRSLQEQVLPGTVGCLDPEETAQQKVSSSAQSISGDFLLCSNSGFGGINGVVILQGVEQ